MHALCLRVATARLVILVVGCCFPIPSHAIEAKLYLQLGHWNGITSLAFSPDGRFLLTGGYDDARLWDARTGAEIRRYPAGLPSVLAFSPDGRYIASGADSPDLAARVWDWDSGKELRKFPGHTKRIRCIAFSSNGRFLVTGSEDRTIRIWDIAKGSEIRRLEGHLGDVTGISVAPDDSFLLSTSADGTARMWDFSTGREIRKFEDKTKGFGCVAISKDGRLALIGSWTGVTTLLDIRAWRELRRFESATQTRSGDSYGVGAVAFAPSGRLLLTAWMDGTVRIWDVATGVKTGEIPGKNIVLNAAAFSPDSRFVALGYSDGTGGLWDANTSTAIVDFKKNTDPVLNLSLSSDGHLLAVSSLRGIAQIWDLKTGSVTQTLRCETDPKELFCDAVFSADARLIAAFSSAGTHIWDTLKRLETRTFHFSCFSACTGALSHDGTLLLSNEENDALTTHNESMARLWRIKDGVEIRRFLTHSRSISRAAFSPDDRYAFTLSQEKGTDNWIAELWDVRTGEKKDVLRGFVGAINSVAFSPDGQVAAFGHNGGAVAFSLATKHFLQFKTASSVEGIAFSSTGHLIVTGGGRGAVEVWNAETGAQIRAVSDDLQVNGVAFSPDDRFILSASEVGTVKIWDASSGELRATLVSFRDGGWAVVDPQGRYDASDPDNTPGLHFVAGTDVIELRQLKQRFYTPGLLAKIWRHETLATIGANLKEVKLVPNIQLTPPSKDSTQAIARLSNRSGGIGQVIIKVNGRVVPNATRGSSGYKPDDQAVELKIDLSGATLSPTGNNVIEVSAFNGENSIQSRGVVADWVATPPVDPSPPRIFAIVAGTSQYADDRMNLRYSAKDAIDIGHALRLAGLGLYNDASRVNVTVLASGTKLEPTKENIRSAFDDVARHCRPQDLLIVYFAGHGQAGGAQRDEYYYFTKEAKSSEIETDPALRSATTVSSSELRDWLYRKNMPLKQVIVLDTCAAGAAFNDVVKLAERRDLSPDQIRAIQFLKDSTGSWILMGSAADAVSYEANRYAQGLVTYALLQGMKGAALDGDRVEVSKLFGFAQREVEDLSRGIGGLQRPILSAPKGQTFPIGMLTEKDRQQIQLAKLKPELLRIRVLDDNDLDSLKLEPLLRAELRAASVPVTRGTAQAEPSIVYLDQVVDEVPDALIPQVRYSLGSGKLKVRIRLIRNGKPVLERNTDLESADPASAGKAIANQLIALSSTIQ